MIFYRVISAKNDDCCFKLTCNDKITIENAVNYSETITLELPDKFSRKCFGFLDAESWKNPFYDTQSEVCVALDSNCLIHYSAFAVQDKGRTIGPSGYILGFGPVAAKRIR